MTECATENIEHTLFLGCSVTSFTCTLGFNEQPTEVNIRLVRDTCASPEGYSKIYYDIHSSGPIRKEWTSADPGFSIFGANRDEPPKLGAAVYFRFGDFEFAGLLQSWTKLNTLSDQDIYDVKIISPVEILDGCQVIIGDYTGPIKGFNIFNVYGFEEVFSANSLSPSYTDPRFPQDGPIMGSFSGAFGGANLNRAGMTWNKIKQGVNILTSSLIPINVLNYEEFSQNGRITYYGGQVNANFGLMLFDDLNISVGLAFGISNELAYYILDISEIPNVPDDYRIAGPSISLLGLVSQVCNDFGFDFYIELLPVRMSGILYKVIKVRTIARTVQPDLDIVQQFITSTAEVIDSSFGRELRNEHTTTFLVGGQKQSVFQVDNGLPDPLDDPEEAWLLDNFGLEEYVRDRISPYFGKNFDGNAIILHTDGISDPNLYYIELELRGRYTWKILQPLLPTTLRITVGEMRAAEAGYDAWTFYTIAVNTQLNQIIDDAGFTVDSLLKPEIFNRMAARDVAILNNSELVNQLAYELRMYRQIIGDIFSQSKQTLMVRIPWVVGRYSSDLSESNSLIRNVVYTDEPVEGGWTEAESILGLPNPSVFVDRMRLDDGSIRPFAAFDILADSTETLAQTSHSTSQFETDESFAVDRQLVAGLPEEGRILYYGFNQDNEIVFLDRINLVSPRVIIRFSTPLDFETSENSIFDNNGWNLALEVAFAEAEEALKRKDLEAELLTNLVGQRIREPDSVALTLKSNLTPYGPWKPNNIIEAGPPGQIRFEKEDDLVPWLYGSYANMSTIAQLRVNSYVNTMSEGELGSVTVHGMPTVPLGAEIASLSGLTSKFFRLNQHLVENRIPNFSTATLTNNNGQSVVFTIPAITFGFWNGSYGPTVTNISIDISDRGVTTQYSFRTYTPKFGILSKLNANRIEQRYIIDEQRRAKLRFFAESRRIQNNYIKELRSVGRTINAAIQEDVRAQAGTPHSVIVGDLIKWDKNITTGLATTGDGSIRRTIIASKDLFELQNNLQSSTGYDNKAIMSWDGLIRPISLSGDGGLPRYAIDLPSVHQGLPSAYPPFNLNTSGGEIVYNLVVNNKYLNPLSNPTGILSQRHTGTLGHDIDILARRTINSLTGENSSLIMPTDSGGFNSAVRADYSNDYRFFGLRGPLVMQGWGYDTDGKPIPNQADTEIAASGGQFASTGLKDKFLPDFLRKSHTWPVAPVDLRFDRSRGVWVSPPQYDFVESTIQQCGQGGHFNASLNLPTLYDSGGNVINAGYVVLKDEYNKQYFSGDKVYSFYNSRSNEYKILGGGQDRHVRIGLVSTVIPKSFSDMGGHCFAGGGPAIEITPSSTTGGQVYLYDWICGDTSLTINGIGGAEFAVCKSVRCVSLGGAIPTGTVVYILSNKEIDDGMAHGVDGAQLWAAPVFNTGTTIISGSSECDCETFLEEFPDGDVTIINGQLTTTTTGTRYTLARGQFTADIDSDDADFTLDNVQLLAGTKDPGTPIIIPNSFFRTYFEDDNAFIVYNNTAEEWRDLGIDLDPTITIRIDSPVTAATLNPATTILTPTVFTARVLNRTVGGTYEDFSVDVSVENHQRFLTVPTGIFRAERQDGRYVLQIPSTGIPSQTNIISRHFQLTQDKQKEYTTVSADILDCNGSTSFSTQVYDPDTRFFGYNGFKGYAIPVLCSTGTNNIRYEISSMEGPSEYVIAGLTGSLSSGGIISGSVLQKFGPENHSERVLGNTAGTAVNIKGSPWLSSSLASGTIALGVLNYTGGSLSNAFYQIVVPFPSSGSPASGGLLGLTTTSIPRATIQNNTLYCPSGNITSYALSGINGSGKAVFTLSSDQTWYNMSNVEVSNNKVVQGKFIQGLVFIDVELCGSHTSGV